MTAEAMGPADMCENRKTNLARLEQVLSKIDDQEPMLQAATAKVREEGVSSLEQENDDEVMPIDFEAAHEAIDRVITAYVMDAEDIHPFNMNCNVRKWVSTKAGEDSSGLGSSSWKKRQKAVRSLSEFAHAADEVAPLVRRALKDSDEDVRETARLVMSRLS